jgi:hypothetical protein
VGPGTAPLVPVGFSAILNPTGPSGIAVPAGASVAVAGYNSSPSTRTGLYNTGAFDGAGFDVPQSGTYRFSAGFLFTTSVALGPDDIISFDLVVLPDGEGGAGDVVRSSALPVATVDGVTSTITNSTSTVAAELSLVAGDRVITRVTNSSGVALSVIVGSGDRQPFYWFEGILVGQQ